MAGLFERWGGALRLTADSRALGQPGAAVLLARLSVECLDLHIAADYGGRDISGTRVRPRADYAQSVRLPPWRARRNELYSVHLRASGRHQAGPRQIPSMGYLVDWDQ